MGILTASDIFQFEPEELNARVEDIPQKRKLIVSFPDESCKAVAEKMSLDGVGRVLVVDPHDPRKLLGIITRSDLLKARHRHYTEEQKREQIFKRNSSDAGQR
jgi:CIC family chloride channel protein